MNTSSPSATMPFNEAYVRQQLLTLPQFTASPGFKEYVQWRGAGQEVLALPGRPTDAIEPVQLIVVGQVTTRAYLEPQGNFNPMWQDPLRNAIGAKLVFDVGKPLQVLTLGGDYDTSFDNLSECQTSIAKTNKHNHFLNKETRTMRFSFPLWEPRSVENTTPARDSATYGYTVNPACTPWFNSAKNSHHIRLMPVYDVEETLITRPDLFALLLIGSVVEVTFTLRHYHMAVTSTRTDASDTFSARVESVSVLCPPPPVLQSPIRMISPRKPPRQAQTPTRHDFSQVKQPSFTANPMTVHLALPMSSAVGPQAAYQTSTSSATSFTVDTALSATGAPGHASFPASHDIAGGPTTPVMGVSPPPTLMRPAAAASASAQAPPLIASTSIPSAPVPVAPPVAPVSVPPTPAPVSVPPPPAPVSVPPMPTPVSVPPAPEPVYIPPPAGSVPPASTPVSVPPAPAPVRDTPAPAPGTVLPPPAQASVAPNVTVTSGGVASGLVGSSSDGGSQQSDPATSSAPVAPVPVVSQPETRRSSLRRSREVTDQGDGEGSPTKKTK
ncbi:hypothetical protein JR316_0004219 [Psilocybe cubensis]|uniref:Uncharacterized protein n=2 Tax=Psilocybe cubensis TaxID=181762 RepID=A0ACB8H2Q5_PSICU|nr:hypothetical protein JR316_0010266 [Psilocybe cubensis]XP_047749749.1 hypothetical protein JR316_0004219 [Psilocybe cubensis]KAH9478030.1 hypothetical protein JR316_0010266 [Psilocybe cubensis]KAH9482124.1 hypothetical protein JR316_0004219 [Psilocybe cubensis]